MKKRNLVLVIPAILLVFGLVMSCGPAEEDIVITLDSVTPITAGGTTTSLTLSFSPDPLEKPIASFSASEITLSPAGIATVTGVPAGNWPTFTVNIAFTENATDNAELTVTVKKSGYTTASKGVTVNISDTDLSTLVAAGAAKYFKTDGRIATYKLGNDDTIERVIFDKTNVKIQEKPAADANWNDSTNERIYFSINKWEKANVPTWSDDSYSSSTFKVAYKVTGYITDAKPVNVANNNNNNTPSLYGGATARNFVENDIKKGSTAGTLCWMYLYLDEDGDYLVRSPFSKSDAANASGNNGNGPVRGSNDAVRCYE